MNALGKANSTTPRHPIACMRMYVVVLEETRMYRDGVMSDFVSWCRHLLVPFLFHEVTSLQPPSLHRNDFSTCSTHFSIWATNVDLCTRMRTQTTPPPPCTRACYGVVQCLPVKSPTIYRRNLQREKNDHLVSVHLHRLCRRLVKISAPGLVLVRR